MVCLPLLVVVLAMHTALPLACSRFRVLALFTASVSILLHDVPHSGKIASGCGFHLVNKVRSVHFVRKSCYVASCQNNLA